MRTLRWLLLVLAVLLVAGCTVTRTSMTPVPTAPPSASAPASASESAAPSALASSPTVVGEAAFRAAIETAMSDLMAAIGNPDTGSKSDASSAFDDALERGDPADIRSTADVVLAHLEHGRQSIARVSGYQAGADVCREWDLMLAGIAEGITAMRDGGVQGSTVAVEAGRRRMGEVLQDHFWPAIRGPGPVTVRSSDGRSMTASRERYSMPVANAFDGSATSAWTSGDAAAPQWVELDLGWAATITGVRLLTFQDIPGASDHKVTVRSAGGPDRDLARFSGTTTDRQWLEYTAPVPVPDVQVVRVTTLDTPGMVGWREMEVIVAPSSTPSACPSGSDALTPGAEVMGEPSLPGHEPALAVDGQASTSWDPGEPRGPGNVRGWVRVILPREAFVAQVRLLLGQPAGASVEYLVTGWSASGQSFELGKSTQVTRDGQWLSVDGPTPCRALRMIDVGVTSESPAAAIREIQVLGTTAP